MKYFAPLLTLAFLVSFTGCKKEKPPESTQKTEQPVPPAAKTPEAKPKPVVLPEAKLAATQRKTPYKRKLPESDTACMLACNKAQSCGTARGGVTACVSHCLETLKAPDGELAGMAMGFRAQALCANKPCAKFDACVAKALLGEEALAAAPPLSPSDANPTCLALCEHEKKCHEHEFSQRPGGMGTCRFSCRSILVNPEPDMAPQRALMMKTHKCIQDDCKAFETCVRQSIQSK